MTGKANTDQVQGKKIFGIVRFSNRQSQVDGKDGNPKKYEQTT